MSIRKVKKHCTELSSRNIKEKKIRVHREQQWIDSIIIIESRQQSKRMSFGEYEFICRICQSQTSLKTSSVHEVSSILFSFTFAIDFDRIDLKNKN